MTFETKELYTPTDVKKVRELLVKEQNGLCLITKEPLVKPCCDHAHDDEMFVRGVLSHGINIFLGQIENAYKRRISWWCDIPLPDLLHEIAEYIARPEDKRYRHPAFLKRLQVQFNKLSEPSKREVLKQLGSLDGKNSTERKKLFKELLKTREFRYNDVIQIIMEML